MDDLLREFLTEASEGLAVLDVELVKLEQTPDDPTLLGSIFRIVHTIKGTCGFLALPRLEKVAHASENVLGKYRDGEIKVTPDSITLILESLDAIKLILSVIEETEAEPEGDDADLIVRLNLAAEGKTADAVAAGDTAAAEPTAEPTIEELMSADGDGAEASETVEVAAADGAPEVKAPAVEVKKTEPKTTPNSAKKTAPPAAEKSAADNGGKRPESAIAAQSIRVHVDLLEDLMTMVSELVLTRNQLLQIMRGREDAELAAPLQRINQVTSELQEGVMKTRMQPIGNAWAKLPRIVRDLGLELNKKFDLQMIGEDTELDRQILELIRDPLTHMVRNSCDHGIGTPEERVADGKPEIGKIILDAHHEGGHIIVRISDDGRGLPIEMIKSKALDNEIVTEAQLATMTDQQIQQLIFSAGLSTAEQVTNVSGRGVGMDVVKTNIEKIGGNIEMQSVEGKGTTFTIKIPLTLAIVNALIVEVAGERFAIPQISVTELVRASAESEHRLEHINGVPVLRLRDRLLPLVSLRKLMKLDNDERAPVDEKGSEADDQPQSAGDGAAAPAKKTVRDNKETFVVVCHAGTFAFGIIVDRVFDTEEIVVKPVAPILRDLTLFSGNTILGDGSVIMILDPNGILAAAGEIGAAESEETESKPGVAAGSGERVALLLFRAGGSIPKAVPLALVARLEEFDADKIEHTNGRSVVQYRDQLMPLITVDRDSVVKTEDRQPVIVFSDRDRSMGIVVDEIVDIVEEVLSVELPAQPGSGLLGSAIIAEQATDIIDVAHYLIEAFDDWFGVDDGASHQAKPGARSVLLVDDSPFFRNLLTPLLSVAGYQVTTAESGDAAMDMCKSGAKFDIIVSDIEMPGMNGFEFAEAVRSTPEWEATPLVALSSLASPEDLERGRAAGFSDYVAKFDRDALLQSLAQSLTADRGAA